MFISQSTYVAKSARLLGSFKVVVIASAVTSLLSGCSAWNARNEIEARAEEARAQSLKSSERFGARINQVRSPESDEVDRPFLAGEPVPLAPEVTLPTALRRGVSTTILFKSRNRDLMGLAEGITSATGIPVRVKPDALLPIAQFLPRVATAGSGSPQRQEKESALESTTIDITADDVPLASLLDRVSSRMGVSWRFDGRAIEIFRLDTRSYTLRALPLKGSSASGLGRNGDQKGAFDSSSSTRYSHIETDPLVSIKAAIETRMTKSGVGPVISGDTGTIVLTDTKEVLDQVGEMIEKENRRATRRVELVFEVTDVQMDDTKEIGIDISGIYSAFAHSAGLTTWNAKPLASLVQDTAGSLGVTSSGGSNFVVKALSEVGKVLESKRIPVVTVNRRPATYAIRSTFNYVDQVTGAGSSTNGGSNASVSTGPTVTQKDETVGTVLTVLPDVGDDGVVTMAVAYDSSSLVRLTPYTVGSASSQITVQQKQVDGAGMVQQVITRAGVPTVLAVMDRSTEKSNGRRLDKDAPMLLGGSDTALVKRSITVLTVTAIARDEI